MGEQESPKSYGSILKGEWDAAKHPRGKTSDASTPGSFAPSGLASLLARIREPDGGFTIKWDTGEEPHEGFALSLHPERSQAVPVGEITLQHLIEYHRQNAGLLVDNYLGGWHDPESHKIFLDISTVTKDEVEARRLALAHDQIAYFDFKTMKSVTVNPKATSGGVT